jgi:hypothetical protein
MGRVHGWGAAAGMVRLVLCSCVDFAHGVLIWHLPMQVIFVQHSLQIQGCTLMYSTSD